MQNVHTQEKFIFSESNGANIVKIDQHFDKR